MNQRQKLILQANERWINKKDDKTLKQKIWLREFKKRYGGKIIERKEIDNEKI
jgi:hypothetical protein